MNWIACSLRVLAKAHGPSKIGPRRAGREKATSGQARDRTQVADLSQLVGTTSESFLQLSVGV
jgi:hypothetical protein